MCWDGDREFKKEVLVKWDSQGKPESWTDDSDCLLKEKQLRNSVKLTHHDKSYIQILRT